MNKRPEGLHEGVDDDEDEGDKEVEEEPDVNHLQVGGIRQTIIYLSCHFQNHKHQYQLQYHQYQSNHHSHCQYQHQRYLTGHQFKYLDY